MAMEPIEKAWRLHDVQVQWTTQVDSKASFVLAVETALAAGVVTLAGDGHRLSHAEPGWTAGLLIAGVVAMIVALSCIVLAVRPKLRAQAAKTEYETAYIYFGHVRLWDPEALSTTLETGDMLPVLSKQVVDMAGIAWKKHRYVQWSVTAAAVSMALIGIAAVLNG